MNKDNTDLSPRGHNTLPSCGRAPQELGREREVHFMSGRSDDNGDGARDGGGARVSGSSAQLDLRIR